TVFDQDRKVIVGGEVYSIAYLVTPDVPGLPPVTQGGVFNVQLDGPNNAAPSLGELADQVIREGEPLSLVVSASDADTNQRLIYQLDPGAPLGMSIDPATGVLTWVPVDGTSGSDYRVSVRVTDNGSPNLSAT